MRFFWIYIAVVIGIGVIMMRKKDPLKQYHQRRDFTVSPEPKGHKPKKAVRKKPIFVIQKHAATRLHYDFRIEVEGVLKSWALPKGPSTNPRDKRLAIPTDDHPIEYAQFEGVIPEGHYGAGTVMVWDIGTYHNIKKRNGNIVPMKQCIKDGTIEVFLEGEKLFGAYALILTGKSGDERWLFIKMRDKYADARRNPVSSQPKSVLTGRTIKQIERAGVEVSKKGKQ